MALRRALLWANTRSNGTWEDAEHYQQIYHGDVAAAVVVHDVGPAVAAAEPLVVLRDV